jgi:hypothetical protein
MEITASGDKSVERKLRTIRSSFWGYLEGIQEGKRGFWDEERMKTNRAKI